MYEDIYYTPSEQEVRHDWYDENYFSDPERDVFWIRMPKVATKSMRKVVNFAEGFMTRHQAEVANKHCFTVGAIRHPLDRACAGITGTLLYPKQYNNDLRFRVWKGNCHVRPQYRSFAGLRVDCWIRFEHLLEDWSYLWDHLRAWRFKHGLPRLDDSLRYQPLPHINARSVRQRVEWRDLMRRDQWEQHLPAYEDDWKLCPEWERL